MALLLKYNFLKIRNLSIQLPHPINLKHLTYQKHTLNFTFKAGTSRGILTQKTSWILFLHHQNHTGIGECGVLQGLSIDDRPDFEDQLKWLQTNINEPFSKLWEQLHHFPSIQFGLEMALKSLESQHPFILFDSEFTNSQKAIPINGLVWMGDKAFMKQQMIEKINQGFKCVKLKIGALNFQDELDLIKYLRVNFNHQDIALRVDANGAFSTKNALEKLKQLSEHNIHSIEQPIAVNQWQEMAKLCEISPIPIALDEELIGVYDLTAKEALLKTIKPDYLIFKPSLIGGYKHTMQWIDLCKKYNTKWWVTSALESAIGLNAIAQWCFIQHNQLPQGLGTGSLYHNNFKSPLVVRHGALHYDKTLGWDEALV